MVFSSISVAIFGGRLTRDVRFCARLLLKEWMLSKKSLPQQTWWDNIFGCLSQCIPGCCGTTSMYLPSVSAQMYRCVLHIHVAFMHTFQLLSPATVLTLLSCFSFGLCWCRHWHWKASLLGQWKQSYCLSCLVNWNMFEVVLHGPNQGVIMAALVL